MTEIIAQIIGVIACMAVLLSYQCKTQKHIMIFQAAQCFLYSVNLLMLGMYSGMFLNVIGLARALIYTQRNSHKWAASKIWVFVFIPLIVASGVISCTVFEEGWVAFFPVCGMIITTFAGRCKEASKVRLLTLFNSPFWLTYNIIGGSIGAIMGEVAGSASIIIGMIRLDRKKKTASETESDIK